MMTMIDGDYDDHVGDDSDDDDDDMFIAFISVHQYKGIVITIYSSELSYHHHHHPSLISIIFNSVDCQLYSNKLIIRKHSK